MAALVVTQQPPEHWYKDEGGQTNFMTVEVQVPPSVVLPPGPTFVTCSLAVYAADDDACVDDAVASNVTWMPSCLAVETPNQLYVTPDLRRLEIRFRILKVSRRVDDKPFVLWIGAAPARTHADADGTPAPPPFEGVWTTPILVFSKRRTQVRALARSMMELSDDGHGDAASGDGSTNGGGGGNGAASRAVPTALTVLQEVLTLSRQQTASLTEAHVELAAVRAELLEVRTQLAAMRAAAATARMPARPALPPPPQALPRAIPSRAVVYTTPALPLATTFAGHKRPRTADDAVAVANLLVRDDDADAHHE